MTKINLGGYMPYSQAISRNNPTLFVFLIDQSASMSDEWNAGSGKSRADEVARILNKVLASLVKRSTTPDEGTKDYYDISIIGYGSDADFYFAGGLHGQDVVSLSMLAADPIHQEPPQWVEPNSDMGGTNMIAAFQKAQNVVSDWIAAHPDAFPPTIFNITDGEYNGGNPGQDIQALKDLATSDGNCLLWNIHISSEAEGSVVMPKDDSELSSSYAQELFSWASILPHDSLRFQNVEPDMRAFAFNADTSSFLDCIRQGTNVDR